MVNFDPHTMTVFLALLFAVAAVTLALTLGVVARALLADRRVRLVRRESIPAYYGRLVAHH